MLFFKHMNRFLNFINALQCLVRYLPFNLSRLISLNSRSKEKRLTIYICVYLYIYIYIDIHIYSYSLWLSPQQLVEMNTKCINLFILQDTKWQLKDFFFTVLAEFPHPSFVPWYADITKVVSTLSENKIWNWLWVHSFHSSCLSN